MKLKQVIMLSKAHSQGLFTLHENLTLLQFGQFSTNMSPINALMMLHKKHPLQLQLIELITAHLHP
jgi:hypothetical protein